MTQRTVTTQADLDKAIADRIDLVIINSPAGVWLTISHNDSATVRASGSATVRASGSATVRATPWVAVHLHSGAVDLTGGTIIDHASINLTDPATWCTYHGVQVTDGIATMESAVAALAEVHAIRGDL